MHLLRQSWRTELFDDTPLQFDVYRTANFASPMTTGVSLFLYRVGINSTQRIPSAIPQSNGQRRRTQLPLDLYFILTPWAKEASLEQAILGWMMRALEDVSIFPAGLLNSLWPGVFDEEETIEVLAGQLSVEEMFRIWDNLPGDFQISVPYVARIVRIDSEQEVPSEGVVLTKQLEYGVLKRS